MSEQSANAHTYAKLFPEQLADPCDPDAPESNTGPIAYLHALYQQALELEQASTSSARQLLAQRRPDIAELPLDPAQLEQPVSALALAIHTLARNAQARAGATAYLPEVLASAGQHANLPFHYAHEQIKALLKYRKIPYFELLQQATYSYPGFCYQNLRTDELRQTMRNASGFSPALQALLLEEKALRSTGDQWRKWYGMENLDAKTAKAALMDVETFCQRTGLSFEQVLEMLAVSGVDDNAQAANTLVHNARAYRPARDPAISKFHNGAAYINARRTTRLTIKDAMAEAGIKAQFDMIDYDCLSRMYQMIHLQRELGLPFADVDLLLMSILRAEGMASNWHLTPTTLRALGVFRYQQDAYGISAEQFSALVCEVCPYAVGDRLPMLDRVLDGLGAGRPDTLDTLILDGRAFDPDDGADGQLKVLPALAKAVGADEQTTLAYLAQARQALGLNTFTVSLPLLSSLFRLSRLHRLFKRSPREAAALAALLATTGCDVMAQLAGTPVIDDSAATDVLDTLIALSNLDQWLRKQQIVPSVLLEALAPVPTTQVALERKLLDTLKERYSAIEEALLHWTTETQQQELAAQLLISVFGAQPGGTGLTTQHAAPLLRWSGTSAKAVLEAARTLTDTNSQPEEKHTATQLWFKLERRCALSTLLRLSPGALQALVDHPEWFDLEAPPLENMSLDLCYQLSRFCEWIELCRKTGADERDAIDYLARHRANTTEAKVAGAAKALAALIDWSEDEVKDACPCVQALASVEDTRPTFDDFLETLSEQERSKYNQVGIKLSFRDFVVRKAGAYAYTQHFQSMLDKFVDFLKKHPGPVLLTQAQHQEAYDPTLWEEEWKKYRDTNRYAYFPLTLEALTERPHTVKREVGIPCVPCTISDIDFILRLKTLCTRTGLACSSLLGLAELDETAPYLEYESISQLLLAGADDGLRECVDKHTREHWRDALAGYLIAYWPTGTATTEASFFTSLDDLSTYCLCDISVSSAVSTTLLNQAIGSLQLYLSRLYARLEPGYGQTSPSGDSQVQWQSKLGLYGTWKRDREQRNHPANLIYYANRPNKSVAFQELEVELNQGKMDTTLLQTAIFNYLAKFERVSNLQVISGYLDSHDPKNGTYHLLAKTNTTPYEYYWRTLDMALRDDQERLSPLAWSEWEKVGLAATDEIAKGTDNSDVIRPVVIAGRRYIFWVERSSTDLPDGESANKTLAKKRKFSVQYAFQQCNGTWSTGNELMRLDGFDKQGNWNPKSYAKGMDFKPGLIVVVNIERARQKDPWLVALLYDSDNAEKTESVKGTDFFIEVRDLLLVDSKPVDDTYSQSMIKGLLGHYKNSLIFQHPYDGNPLKVNYAGSNSTSYQYTPPSDQDLIPKFNVELTPDPELDNTLIAKVALSGLERVPEQKYLLGFSILQDEKIIHEYNPSLDKNTATPYYSGLTREQKQKLTDCIHEFSFNYTQNTRYTFELSISHVGEESGIRFIFFVEPCGAEELWNVSLANNSAQTQYLDLTKTASLQPTLIPRKIRLNTLFGKSLVARATQGVNRVLAWDTQILQEPDLDNAANQVNMDFHGANALYFRELFLHVPAMIAMRLTEQQQFEEAEDWYLHYLFNPYRTEPDEEGRPAPWCTRPLSEVGTLSSTLSKDVDPISRVFVLARHYQQAIYLAFLENWLAQGDHYYRQLTLSALNQAWLCYQQALKLLGPLPQGHNASRWAVTTLGALGSNAFRRPLNRRVLDLDKTLQSRLFNLRHGLTLDGKLLPPLDWSSESLEAFGNSLGGVSNLPLPYRDGQLAVPHYRFRQLLPIAKAAAQQLSDFGRHYMKLMEDEFNTSLSVQLKAQDIKMVDFAIRIQKEAISGVQAKKKALLLSRNKAAVQKNYISGLIDVGRSSEEESATALTWMSHSARLSGALFQHAAAAVGVAVPTIYGMAVGGNKADAMLARAAKVTEIYSDTLKCASDELLQQAAYNRRAAEWAFEKSQVEWDLKILDQQLDETNIELNASTIALAQCEQDRVNLKEAYVSMTTGFTIIPVYNWLVARQEHLYGAAYDAVRSLCLAVEAAWRYEIGDYRRSSFIDTTAWRDNYKGMLVGESLLVNLQQMENEYLLNNERRLTIKKSFSLKDRLGETAWTTVFKKPTDPAVSIIHSFAFMAADFDRSYPGHYLRQLKYVSVTLVLKADANLDELCATLTQTGSTTLLEADKDAARSLYPAPAGRSEDEQQRLEEAGKDPKRVLRNPSVNQQIALSSTVAEDGLGYDPGTWVYELMFHDGRYLPFEGTGAISEWTLEILGSEQLLADPSVIADIRLNMVYTAKAGDIHFSAYARSLCKPKKSE
ncbi:Tc toxin subunit A [Pseudomonas sp. zfem004]|uniref:Tc toxin subunit A-related protein n=1 Tax=Pseudomonas sp. zfem004 TaxID=3078199 RepID=UPI002927D095|nr:neuraminidase-like domain-containing protein [Pseudomonas sp. zfem004]MDU9402198.1 Tc toxin subunit A [Pseudomonas sp. zfem004]